MNAKKIMGAVLVAFLAAALFVGAGAAATSVDGDGETVFVNQILTGITGTWVSGNNAVTVTPVPGSPSGSGEVYFAGPVVEGVYTQEQSSGSDLTIVIKNKPAVTITGIANSGVNAYNFIGGILYAGANPVNVYPSEGESTLYDLYYTAAGEQEVQKTANAIGTELKNAGINLKVGEYSIRAVFKSAQFIDGTLASDLVTAPVTFKVAKPGEVTIAGSVDQVLRNDAFKLTITGEPGVRYDVVYDNAGAFTVSDSQVPFVGTGMQLDGTTGFHFTMPNTGSVEFAITGSATAKDSEKITVFQNTDPDNKAGVTVKFIKGNIYDVKTDAASYFVGDKVTINGVSTAGTITNLTIKGTNFEAKISGNSLPDIEYGTETEMTFEFELETANILNQKTNFVGKKMDVGTYTVKIETASAEATVSVTLKQPFISIVEAPEVIVQDTEVEFVINAEAVKGTTPVITYYLFGTNFFDIGEGDQDEDVKTNYIVTLDEDYTKNMSAGQYFAVFQHPMYDGYFNILADANGKFFLNTSGDALTQQNSFLFAFNDRQTANAAQALCDALDSQNIDDMYVKYSFFVVGEDEAFTINEIPAEVAQGSTFTVSGTSTAAAGKIVQVEMISTAFAAVPKETVGSAAFIVVTTEVAEDGTWEVTLDTSDLNVDEYSLKVACGDDTWKNTKINVVEAADKPVTPPTDEPGQDEPGQDEPVAPETPGFGALAALAGLGAVAVLLLRRE